ncbi:MAG: PIN domain-containing protein [Chitinophagaceae bacterium]|uniref:PIN domain-containing protein n=1 Tax=unclassified Paraflavitalea TaxID=2798305 RepID=UPI003D32A666|nr:PIN domain-containing protein [Chitinophagaceae bacterium]
MIHREKQKVVLDTNVIYPVIVRDILFWFAHYDLFIPHWTEHIFQEWKRILIKKGISENQATGLVERANYAFPNAFVKDYHFLTDQLTLPDQNDCHVLAAAIVSKSSIIVTNNLKDFPESYLKTFEVTTKTADTFLADIIIKYPDLALDAFLEMIKYKKNPPISPIEMLSIYKRIGLSQFSDQLTLLL